jgi:phage tail tape-measure protein
MAKRKWMAEAFANSHGQFRAKARAAGKSTAAFAKQKERAPGKLGRQARLAEVGMKASRGERWYGSKED